MPPTFSIFFQGAGVFTFFGLRGGKKDGKIGRCVLEVLVGRFWLIFGQFVHNCLVLSTRTNLAIYHVFVPLVSQKTSDNMLETA